MSERDPTTRGAEAMATPRLQRTLLAQPDDWKEPGAYRVAEGVYRIPLPMPGNELGAVNVYAILGAEGIALVDSGWAVPEAAAALDHALRSIGFQSGDVSRVLSTHAHHDHYTHGLALRAAYGTTVLLGRNEAFSIDAYAQRLTSPNPQLELLRRCGAAALAAALEPELSEQDRADDSPWGLPDGWLDDGEAVTLDCRRLLVVATPGHTRGHIILRDTEAGLLFAGDHVLPHITPSIGYERAPSEAPLRDFLASLRLVRDMPDALLLPAHGPATLSAHCRIDELLTHHGQRLEATEAAVRHGASTAFAVAQQLPWTRRARKLDDLAPVHAALAILETSAHLDVLVDQRLLAKQETLGVVRYHLT
jgi:glyoxylase-like metal-dependent hydrolase (beta-lactamase superfamily II)